MYFKLIASAAVVLYCFVSVVKGLKDCPNYSDTGPHAYLCVNIVTSKSGPGSGLSCARDGTTIQIVTHAGNRVYSHCDSDIYTDYPDKTLKACPPGGLLCANVYTRDKYGTYCLFENDVDSIDVYVADRTSSGYVYKCKG